MFKNYYFDPKDPTGKYQFEIHNIDLSIVNAIRRNILSEIKIPGIIGEIEPSVEIINSNGPLHNEYLIHRIGLIPICLKEDSVENYIDNQLELSLNVSNTRNNTINVTTQHITGTFNDIELTKKELNELFYPHIITNDYILITRLRENETLHFKAKVVKKNGKYNSSFNPVSLANFSFIIDESKITKELSILDKERAYYVNEYGDPNAFLFEIEPINKYLSAKYLINKSIEILIEKLNTLIINIKTNNNINIYRFNDLINTYEFSIDYENDTLGNVIQCFIHNKFVRKNDNILDNITCSYCGYICPHPLKELLNIRITLDNQNELDVFKKFLEYNCFSIIDELQDIKIEWNKFI